MKKCTKCKENKDEFLFGKYKRSSGIIMGQNGA